MWCRVRSAAADALPASGNDYTTVNYGTTTVTTMTPTQGSTSGGTAVVITGTNMYGVTGVTFDTTAGTSISHDSNTQLTVYSPAHAAATNSVVLSYGTSSTVTAGSFTWNVNAPTITSITPGSGPTSGGTVVTIIGTNFTPTTTVLFGPNAAATFTYVSSTQITVTSPPGTAGPAVNVTTTNGTGSTAYGAGFVYYTTPVPTGLTPVQGPTTGFTTVNISGSGFTSVTGVDFGGTAASSYTINSDTSITASTPAHAAGATTAHLTYGGGTVAAGTFTFIGAADVHADDADVGLDRWRHAPSRSPARTCKARRSASAACLAPTSIVAPDGIEPDVRHAGRSRWRDRRYRRRCRRQRVGGQLHLRRAAGHLGPRTDVGPGSWWHQRRHHRHRIHRRNRSAIRRDGGGELRRELRHPDHCGVAGRQRFGHGRRHNPVRFWHLCRHVHLHSAAGGYRTCADVWAVHRWHQRRHYRHRIYCCNCGEVRRHERCELRGELRHADHRCHRCWHRVSNRQRDDGQRHRHVVGTFTFLPAPTVSGLAPNFGPEAGGTSVVITGTGFTGATAVKFGTTNAASYVVNSATSDHRCVTRGHRLGDSQRHDCERHRHVERHVQLPASTEHLRVSRRRRVPRPVAPASSSPATDSPARPQ